MIDVDPITGLPKELGTWEAIAKEGQRIKIRIIKRKYGKMITLVEGISKRDIDLKDLTKKLKSSLACGGTLKGDVIELQGNHANRVEEELIKLGFSKENISVLKG